MKRHRNIVMFSHLCAQRKLACVAGVRRGRKIRARDQARGRREGEGRDGKGRRKIFLPIILRSRFQYPALKSKLPTLGEGRFWDHKG